MKYGSLETNLVFSVWSYNSCTRIGYFYQGFHSGIQDNNAFYCKFMILLCPVCGTEVAIVCDVGNCEPKV